MWTSNSGPPFNQPSKSSTKWALVRYRPGTAGGGGGSGGHGNGPPHARQMMAAGSVEKSVSTGTTAITGVAGGRSVGRAIELALHGSAEGGVAEREREGARQELGVSRRGEDNRSTCGLGRGAGRAVGAGERAHQQGERCGP